MAYNQVAMIRNKMNGDYIILSNIYTYIYFVIVIIFNMYLVSIKYIVFQRNKKIKKNFYQKKTNKKEKIVKLNNALRCVFLKFINIDYYCSY